LPPLSPRLLVVVDIQEMVDKPKVGITTRHHSESFSLFSLHSLHLSSFISSSPSLVVYGHDSRKEVKLISKAVD
jgi:hypothetical protein